MSWFPRSRHRWCASNDTTGNGTATHYDSRGGSDASLLGSAAWETDTDSGGVRAIDLDATSGTYLNCGTLPSSSRAVLSAGGWVKPRAHTSQHAIIQNLDSGSGLQGFFLGQGTSGQGNVWRAYLDTGGTSVNVVSPSTITLNVWQHVLFTYDGATVRLYVNGSEVETGAFTGAIPDSAAAHIGHYSGIYSDMLVDDVRVIESALTAAMVTEMYDGLRGYERPRTARLTRLGLTATPATQHYFPTIPVAGRGSAAGSASTIGAGASTAAADGASAGTASASGSAVSTAAATGSASGTGSATATAISTAAADGVAAGSATASGAGNTAGGETGAGTAAGTATASGVGKSTAAAAGVAAGIATASGDGKAKFSASAASAGTSSATGVGRLVAAAVAAASGDSTVSGVGSAKALAAGTASGSATCTATSPTTTAGFIVVASASISVASASATISVPRATATILGA